VRGVEIGRVCVFRNPKAVRGDAVTLETISEAYKLKRREDKDMVPTG
jgi:hypothetical protein